MGLYRPPPVWGRGLCSKRKQRSLNSSPPKAWAKTVQISQLSGCNQHARYARVGPVLDTVASGWVALRDAVSPRLLARAYRMEVGEQGDGDHTAS